MIDKNLEDGMDILAKAARRTPDIEAYEEMARMEQKEFQRAVVENRLFELANNYIRADTDSMLSAVDIAELARDTYLAVMEEVKDIIRADQERAWHEGESL